MGLSNLIKERNKDIEALNKVELKSFHTGYSSYGYNSYKALEKAHNEFMKEYGDANG